MDNQMIVDKLSSLAKLDIDAANAYATALKQIDESSIYTQIDIYREDHERHFNDLSVLIRKYGGMPPTKTTDIRGMFLGGMTALQSMIGIEGALKGLLSGEMVTNEAYKDAVNQSFPEDVLIVLNQNYNDEKKHKEYIDTVLKTKAWERRKAA